MEFSTFKKYALLREAVFGSRYNDGLEVVRALVADNFAHTLDTETSLAWLEFLLELEGGIGDHEGAIRGPYQFGRSAWMEAGEGLWEVRSVDLMYSSRAAIRYYLMNKNRFEKLFPDREYTFEIAYLYHNQGPSGAAYFLRNGKLRWPKQSRAAIKIFNSIER